MNAIHADLVVQSLADLKPSFENFSYQEGIRLLLYDVWYSGLPRTAVEGCLSGTWAGGILQAMKAHSRQREEAQIRHESTQVAQKAAKVEKWEQKRLRHAQRLARKKERDATWRERQIENDGSEL